LQSAGPRAFDEAASVLLKCGRRRPETDLDASAHID
jgi:hypothetical protein